MPSTIFMDGIKLYAKREWGVDSPNLPQIYRKDFEMPFELDK